jgi:two-component system response regulator
MSEKFILLVENNPGDEVLTLRALRKNNISSPVVVKRDGAEALPHSRRRANKIAARRYSDVVSGRHGSGQRHDFGANGYVRKPVDFVQFAEAVRQIGLYWLIINEPAPTAGNTCPSH